MLRHGCLKHLLSVTGVAGKDVGRAEIKQKIYV